MSIPDRRDLNDQPDLASHLRDLGPTESDDGVLPTKDAAATPRGLQDMEQSLVERIADIDDERRRTSTQLRKALQTHIDDVEARLSVARRILAALSIVVLLLAAGIIWLGIDLQAQQRQLALETTEQRAQPADSSTNAGDGQASDALAERVAESESDSGLDSGADASPDQDAETATDMSPTATSAVIDQSQPAPTSNEGAISESAQDPTGASSADADSASPRSPDDLQAEQDQLQAQIAAARDQQAGIDESDRLPIDELIDDQLNRLEREYQRLARQIDAPAVQQPRAPESTSASTSASASASNGTDGEGQMPLAADSAPTTEYTTDSIETTEASIALQLIGFHSREELNAFLSAHAMPNPYYIRGETFRERPWFALIHSLYDNRDAANAAAEALPEDLAQLDLWVRELPAGTTLERVQIKAGD